MAFSKIGANAASKLGSISQAVERGMHRINESPTLSGAAGSVLGALALAAPVYAYEKFVAPSPQTSANEAALKAENKMVFDLLQKQHEAHIATLKALSESAKSEREAHAREVASLQTRIENLEASSSTPWYFNLFAAKRGPSKEAEKSSKGPELH
ncbi:MAG: hypothetical protein K0R66_522 [Gammaproteobacteria bacterium]|jgi:hypothetical protein|nr:hypothetical protein [Gammaproteobacteria bacterium]